MTTTEPSIEAVKRRPLWRRFAAFVFRWTYRVVGTFTILAALFVLVSQTQYVHDWLRDTLLGLANDALEGSFEAEDITIDIFHGIVLDRPVLRAAGTTVLKADQVSVSYDLAALFVRVAAINEVRIVRPDIHVLRSADSVWNVSRIVKPSADTTTSAPPDGTLLIRSLRLTDGTLKIDDRTQVWSDGTWFDPMHLRLEELNINISARIHLLRKDAAFSINGMSFRNKNGPVNVSDLKAVIRTSKEGLDLQSLRLITERNDVALHAKMSGVNILEGFNDSLFATHPLVAHIEAAKVWGPDLHYFIPDVDLADSYGLNANAVYSGNRIDVNDMILTAGDARINGRVTVDELYGDRPMRLDIALKNSTARYADVRRRLLFVPLPELPFLKRTTIDDLVLKGDPEDSLWFVVRGSDAPGSIEGEMTLFLAKPTLGYEVDMKIGRGDLSVFADSSMRTDLNGHVMMVGSGVTLQELAGTTQIELDRSEFAGRQIRTFRTMIRGDGAGTISIDTLFADLTPFNRDSSSWLDDADESIRQTVALSGVVNASDTARLRYSGSVATQRIDMSRLFNNESMPHRLSGTIVVDAEGVELDKIAGTLTANISQFAMPDRAMLPFTLEVESRFDGTSRVFTMSSSFGSTRISGNFVPSALIDAIATSVTSISENVQRRVRHILNEQSVETAPPIIMRSMDMELRIDLVETSMLNMFIPNGAVSGQAMIVGRVQTSPDHIETNLDSCRLYYFSYTTDSSVVYTDPMFATAGYRIRDLPTTPKLEWLSVKGACDSVIRIDDLDLRDPRIELTATTDSLRISASSGVNEMLFSVAASMRATNNEAIIYFDSAYVNIDQVQHLEWRLLRRSVVSISSGVAHFQEFAVQRPWAETVTLNGYASDSLFKGAVIRVDNFPLRDVPKFAVLDESHPVRLLDGLVNEAVITIDGTYEKPEIVAKVSAQDLRYNGAMIGTLQVELQHRERTITGTAVLDDPTLKDNNRTLDLKVKALPLDLAFASRERRLVHDRPIDMELTARKLALAAIEPFLPAVERVRGTANASIAVKGTTPTDISLSGQGTFQNAMFLASATNMVYHADGVMHLKDSYLILDTINIRNVDRDLPGGRAIANGVVVFDGLAVDSVDFQVTTPNKTGVAIMNMASQARSPDIYGDLIIRSGKRPIRMYGKLTKPRLVGDLVVRYSDIVFPKERSTTKARFSTFTYQRSDTTRFDQQSLLEKAESSKAAKVAVIRDPADTSNTIQSAVSSAITQILEPSSDEFIDILEYDLDIYLEGRTLLTMIFGTFEILVADLELVDSRVPLTFTGRFGNNSTNLRGKVRVKEGASTYKFYKPFQTSGTLNFTSGGMTNPGLDLKAVYEDRRILPGTENEMEEYKVELTITGTKQKPRIAYRVWRRNREVVGDSAKVAGDALMLILVGKTQDELMSSGQGDLVGQVNAAFSAVATSALSDLVSGIPMIQNAQLDVGSDISQSRLTLSGQLFGDVSYRVSGQISDFSGNSTFTVSIPLSVLADEEAMRDV
ncbi:MAG: hypothetical protein EHM43_06315, partial [Ignavibacteriae bacterium]